MTQHWKEKNNNCDISFGLFNILVDKCRSIACCDLKDLLIRNILHMFLYAICCVVGKELIWFAVNARLSNITGNIDLKSDISKSSVVVFRMKKHLQVFLIEQFIQRWQKIKKKDTIYVKSIYTYSELWTKGHCDTVGSI